MKKTLIAIPCLDMVHTKFFESFSLMDKEGTSMTTVTNTMIYSARNLIAANAIDAGFDRVLWLDSDMTFPKDMIRRLSDAMDKTGAGLVSGLYFTRNSDVFVDAAKLVDAGADMIYEYPDDIIEIKACGFGCCLTSVDLIKRVGDKFGSPFTPIDGMGEDLSFCYRVSQLGEKMYCDTRIKCGHVGNATFDEAFYKRQGIPAHGQKKG